MFSLKKVFWDDIRETVLKLNPKLAKAIDFVSPDDDCFFYLADYKYGTKMLNQGIWQVPLDDGSCLPLTSERIPKAIKDALNYNMYTNPVYMVIEKVSEFYAEINDTVIPVLQLHPGDVVGLSAILRQKLNVGTPKIGKTIWELCAGSRNCFLVPKVSDKLKNRALQKTYDLNISSPEKLSNQFSVFSAIGAKSDWSHQILIFSKGWFKYIHDVEFAALKSVFYDLINETLSVWANRVSWDMAFAQIYYAQNIPFSNLSSDITKTIFGIASDRQLGFSVVNNDFLLPYHFLKEAYTNVYGIDDYIPLFVAATYLSQSVGGVSYFSFQYPLSSNAYYFRQMHNVLKELDDVRYCFEKHKMALQRKDTIIDAADLVSIANEIKVTCIHSVPGQYSDVVSSKSISNYPEFCDVNKSGEKKFPYAGKFFKGVIRIAK